MIDLTQRILRRQILRSRFLRWALISLALIALQATPAVAQWSAADPNGNIHNTNLGNVRIGTATGSEKLFTVEGTIPSWGAAMSVFRTTGSLNGVGLLMDATGSGNNNLGFALNGAMKASFAWDNGRSFLGFGNLNYSANDFALRINSDGSLTYHDGITSAERLRIAANGNVGINKPSPTEKLDVVGNIKLTGNIDVGGNINAKYQDVAEWVPASEQIPAGTVVVLDSTKSNHVIASSKGYDTRVAGVISAQPGIALGESGNSKVLVATTGRVRIKVDATRTPIHVGDLLVTSDVPGLAMKSEPVNIGGVQLHRPGTLIGKALEPLAKGEGEILVLLSLQ